MGPAMFGTLVFVVILIVFLLAIIVANIKIVPQAHAFVVERLGAFHASWGTGLHVKIPFIDRIAKKVSLKEQVIDFPPQPVITKDNVTMQIDTVVYFQITDPKLYAYGVENPISAIENLTATTLRNIIGEMELDHTLTSRDVINSKIRVVLDEATDAWGIKVNRVELKNIVPPKEIQDSMEKQMKAERERRAKILDAEGEKRSAILIAEGEKESAVLRAEAVKETKIREAQGEAEAVLTVQRAVADAIKLMNEANPSEHIRVGVNSGSLEKDLVEKYGGVTAEGIVESALDKVHMIEEMGYDNLVVSIKSSDVLMCVKAHELIARECPYPLHVGITESGTLMSGNIKSSIGLALILNQGIGDTIRVSLTGDPVEEIKSAKLILRTLGLRKGGIEVVSCPTCGRTKIDLIGLANKVEQMVADIPLDIKVAVMGCVVNGPGEAKEADIGIAGGIGEGLLIKKGEIVKKVKEEELLDTLRWELEHWNE